MANPRVKSRPTVLVPFRDKETFLKHYYLQDGRAGVFVPGNLQYTPGEPVDLELTFMQEQRTFRIRGEVKWRRAMGARHREFPPGIGVELGEDQRTTRDLVLSFVNGKEIQFLDRADTRFPISMEISYKTDATFITDCTDDVSEGGAFIVTPRAIPVGTILPLRLRVPGAFFPLKLRGVVCWTRQAEPSGVGVKFLFDSERQKKKMERLVARLKSQIILQIQGRGRVSSLPPDSDDPAPPA
jgi:uncharacterized protein (TIGR02266 family)